MHVKYGQEFFEGEGANCEPPLSTSRERKKRMSKKKRPAANMSAGPASLELRNIQPLTLNQQRAFDAYAQGYNLNLHGYAGTGKTFIALYLALRELGRNQDYKKIVIVRSVVPARDMGFLPGSQKEKTKVYEEPYREICSALFDRGDAYEILRRREVEFISTSFLRGLTFNDSIIIVDEMQNMLFREIDTVMTRLGDNSKIIFCGDFRQSDLQRHDREGIHQFMSILRRMENFYHVEFMHDDIVRSGVVRDYIIQRTELNL
jgi:phosphate starvation-inducible PhoH-like protein